MIYERIDSIDKTVIGIDYYNDLKVGVVQTHTMSYLNTRRQFEELGDLMGLDNDSLFILYQVKHFETRRTRC